MGKLVVINLVDGNFERGFSVSLQIWTEGDHRQWIAAAKGKLPPAKELHEHYTHWRSCYRDHNVKSRSSTRLSVTGSTNSSIINEIKQASKQLKLSLNNWLKADSNFSPIREKLFQSLKDESEEIRVIFETDNPDLQRLPWHFWDDFFKHYHRSEVALSLPVKKRQIADIRDKVKVVAVFGKTETFGNATRIKTEQDWEMLKNLLAEDSNATLIRLEQPSLDYLCQQIDEHKPQILFFAGHSRSEEDGESGFIDLNDEENSITIEDLEPDLRKAVKRGLQLAIFNSCDGLGIARQLAKLDVPNIIIMREPVPDEVAQKFLQRFLEAFAAGKPLHLAVRRARERINRLENKFPGATWLPMTFENPAESPLTWRTLGGVEIHKQSNQTTVRGIESQTGSQDSILWLSTTVNPDPIPQLQPKTVVSNPSKLSTQIELESNILRRRYKIVEQLGSGGFGDTYLAQDLDLPSKPKCVVKHLKPQSLNPEILLLARRLFESEAEVLYRLSKLNNQIPKLFAHFEENSEFYLVQEFVDGHNLATEIIPGHRWSEGEVVQLLQQILEVLSVVHQQNIIHRDIKPQNLMRRLEDGKIVLIDFGAVKEIKGLMADSHDLVTSTIIIGSNGYMPNEQANARPRLCSDVYAVGVIAIQALTGKLPKDFQEDPNTGEIIWQHEVNVSNELAAVVNRMVRYNFSQRYQSAKEALRDLELLAKPKIITGLFPQQTNILTKITPRKKLHRLFLVTALTALIFVLAGIGSTKVNPIFPKPELPSPTRSR